MSVALKRRLLLLNHVLALWFNASVGAFFWKMPTSPWQSSWGVIEEIYYVNSLLRGHSFILWRSRRELFSNGWSEGKSLTSNPRNRGPVAHAFSISLEGWKCQKEFYAREEKTFFTCLSGFAGFFCVGKFAQKFETTRERKKKSTKIIQALGFNHHGHDYLLEKAKIEGYSQCKQLDDVPVKKKRNL